MLVSSKPKWYVVIISDLPIVDVSKMTSGIGWEAGILGWGGHRSPVPYRQSDIEPKHLTMKVAIWKQKEILFLSLP